MSAVIDNQYIKVPSVTTTERDALTAINGMIVYNSTTATFQKYEAGAWASLGAGIGVSTIKENASSIVTSAVSIDFKDANVEDLGSGAAALYQDLPFICQGRLTLTTAVPVTTSDVTAATTVYFTPYMGSQVSLYDGTRWKKYTFTERSLSTASFTASLPYDYFLYDNAGTLTLEALAWTNTTTRATAIVLQDGVYVKSGATTRRYLGTVCMTITTGQTEDSYLRRLVWNMNNRARRVLRVRDTTDSWTYATASYRAWNNSNANRVEFVRGLNEDAVSLHFTGLNLSAGSASGGVGIGLGSTTVNSAFDCTYNNNSVVSGVRADYKDTPALGYNYLQLLEYASGATATFYGDVGVTYAQTGAVGEVWG